MLASAIFTFRASAILRAHTQDNIKAVFHELTYVKVVPLLQHFLFSMDLDAEESELFS